MPIIPLVRVNAILPLIKFLDQIGVPSERFLRQAKLPVFALDDPQTLIPLYHGFTFAEKVARSEGIELFGILATQQAQIADFGMFGKVICQSLTLHDLLHTISVLLTTTHNSGARVWVTQKNDRVWLNHQYINPANVENQQGQYYACLLYLKAIQLVTGVGWYPTDLHFQTSKLPGLENFELFAGTRVYFNKPNNAIGFAQSLLSLPLKKSSNFYLSHQHQDDESFQSLALVTSFTDSVRHLIRLYLPEGTPDVAFAAEASGLSTRSFQRRLAEVGLSYSHLIDRVRLDLAVTMLQDPNLQLLEIALELGYTDPGNFTRAFRRWTGISPSEFRRQQRWLSDNVVN